MTRDQRGQVLASVLVLLALGALLVIPTVSYSTTGLNATRVTEKKAEELYASDSGVEDAAFWLQEDGTTGGRWNWDAVDLLWRRDGYDLNGRTVAVTIEDLGAQTYKIESTGTSPEGGSTTIESSVVLAFSDFADLLDNAITSKGGITIQPGSTVNGKVQLPDAANLDNKGTMIPPDPIEATATFPTAKELCAIYWDDVWDLGPPSPYADGAVITIPSGTTESAPYDIGPLYCEGDLEIKGKGWARLEGTIYVKGTLTLHGLGNNPYTLFMNSANGDSQTLFAEVDINVSPNVILAGSGCVVALGDVDFSPQIAAGSENDFILVMSVEGTVTLNPGSDFYGAVVGDAHIQLQPGITLNWVSPDGKGLNFPQGTGSAGDVGTTVSIASYTIS